MACKQKRKVAGRSPVKKRVVKKKPAAKRKPAKRKSKRAAGVKVEFEIPNSVLLNAENNVRLFAGQVYATGSCSIAELSRHKTFIDIPQKTLEHWSLTDNWVSERQGFQQKVKTRVQNALANEITRERSTQLKETVDKRDKFSKIITARIDAMFDAEGELLAVDQSSEKLTSLVNSWVKLATLSDQYMEKLGEIMVPATFPEEDSQLRLTANTIRPQLTPEEARAAARLLIKMRREEMRRVSSPGEASQEKLATKLRVVEGE